MPLMPWDESYKASSSTSSTMSEYINIPEDPDECRTFHSQLPREFQVIQESRVPLLQIGSDTSQDFVIIAEFSELEGPIPLCTIPSTIPSKIDLNNFAVHLMFTDYQVNAVGHFNISEDSDTQVFRKNVFKNVHVFMEYFTLYDIKARGFVRPFCFGYVSKDHVKLDRKLETLIREFDKMTKVLKYSNREWFAGELEQYLEKLKTAKDSFFQNLEDKSEDDKARGENVFSFETQSQNSEEDPDAITLQQIAHQYSEIENILRTVRSFECPGMAEELLKFSDFFSSHSESELGSYIRERLKMELSLSAPQASISPLNMPLVHPLKMKGESLRPLTTLGQLGTVYLIWRLNLVHEEHQKDLIFSHMKELTLDFQQHCRSIKKQKKEASPSSSSPTIETTTKEDNSPQLNSFLKNPEVPIILEKIHISCPLPSGSKKSGSYHTVSEQESEQIPSLTENNEVIIEPNNELPSASPERHSYSSSACETSTSVAGQSFGSYSSQSETDEQQQRPRDPIPMPSSPPPPSEGETIVRKSFWEYLETNLPRGQPGNGILKLFRLYPKFAHHILYSILIGRTIVICGSEEQKNKISQILTALIPLVPTAVSKKTWKLLRWHRGVLVNTHIKEFKLIGLCIPERLEIHDLIHSRDKNCVTIFHLLKKSILGPAYSGQFLGPFEAQVQRHFHNSDLSFLAFIGSILTDMQTKIYMCKSLRNNKDMIKATLKASDIDIIRYLSSLCSNMEDILEIF